MRTLFSLILLMLSLCFHAQENLIPNPSFEELDCPDGEWTPYSFGAADWYNCNGATPDYFGTTENSECGLTSIYNELLLEGGEWQFPAEGEFMTGLWAGDSNSCTRDYLQVDLLNTLQEGHQYCFSMKVSLRNWSSMATDCFGAYFHADSLLDFSSPCFFDLQPQVNNPTANLLTDTLNWMIIEGEFEASGDEQYLTIGNFSTNENCEWLEVEGIDPNWHVAYYFVDDLELRDCSTDGVTDSETPWLSIHANPITDYLSWSSLNMGNASLFSISGDLIHSSDFHVGVNFWDLSHISPGIYLLVLVTKSDQYSIQVVKE